MRISTLAWLAAAVAAAGAQDSAAGGGSRTAALKDGESLRLHMAVATEDANRTTAVAFPEESIESVVSGWKDGDLSFEREKGTLILKLHRKAEGSLIVVGSSGRQYRLYVEPVGDGKDYDGHVRILGGGGGAAPDEKKGRAKAVGSLELVRAMRLGRRPDGGAVYEGSHETIVKTGGLEASLDWVYLNDAYIGYVLTAKNVQDRQANVDVTRLAADDLVLAGSRDQTVEAGGTTKLYLVFWRRP
jgi:hypothetical protein